MEQFIGFCQQLAGLLQDRFELLLRYGHVAPPISWSPAWTTWLSSSKRPSASPSISLRRSVNGAFLSLAWNGFQGLVGGLLPAPPSVFSDPPISSSVAPPNSVGLRASGELELPIGELHVGRSQVERAGESQDGEGRRRIRHPRPFIVQAEPIGLDSGRVHSQTIAQFGQRPLGALGRSAFGPLQLLPLLQPFDQVDGRVRASLGSGLPSRSNSAIAPSSSSFADDFCLIAPVSCSNSERSMLMGVSVGKLPMRILRLSRTTSTVLHDRMSVCPLPSMLCSS